MLVITEQEKKQLYRLHHDCLKCEANVWSLESYEILDIYNLTRIDVECYYCKSKRHHYTTYVSILANMTHIDKIDTLYIKNTDYFSL